MGGKKLLATAVICLFPGFVGAAVLDSGEVFQYEGDSLALGITASGHGTARYTDSATGRSLMVSIIPGEENDLDADPEAPPRALEITIFDDEGRVLALQGGAGYYLDGALARDTVATSLSPEARKQDLVQLLPFASLLREEVEPAIRASRLSRWAWIVDQVAALLDYVGIESRTLPSAAFPVPGAPTATYSNVVKIRRKPFLVNPEHSALSSSLYTSTGTLLYTLVTCNHGECASSSVMTTKCTRTFLQSTVDAWASDLICDLYGWPYFTHLCNGDTRAQYLSIKNRARGTWGSCSSPRLYAPPCD